MERSCHPIGLLLLVKYVCLFIDLILIRIPVQFNLKLIEQTAKEPHSALGQSCTFMNLFPFVLKVFQKDSQEQFEEDDLPNDDQTDKEDDARLSD